MKWYAFLNLSHSCILFILIKSQLFIYVLFNIFQFDINLLKPIVESSNVGYVGFRVLLFGENPWSCDCEHVNEIQQFLWHYKDKVPDAEELSCDDDQVSSSVV